MANTGQLSGQTLLGYQVGDKIGEGGFGTVYRVSKRNQSGEYVYALKHITLPSESQYHDVLSSMGGDYTKADNYFQSVLSDIMHEINILSSLTEKDSSHIVIYYDNEIEKQENPLRYDIYIRMEYMTPLTSHIRTREMRVSDVIELGLNILSALEVCHSNQIIHRDIKDDNIFVNRDGKYKLGDFGVAKLLKDSSRAASVKGTPAYIAPEVYLGKEKYNNAVDLYSLGIVLYKMLNFSRIPFLPDFPDHYEMEDVDIAIGKRLAGEIPELPVNAPQELGHVLVKAISSPLERFQDARSFKEALLNVRHRLSANELKRVINQHILQAPAGSADSRGSEGKPSMTPNMRDYEATVGAGARNSEAEPVLMGGGQEKQEKQEDYRNLFATEGVRPAPRSPKPVLNDEMRLQIDPAARLNALQTAGQSTRQVITPVSKRDFIWMIYSAPLVVILLAAILFYAVVPGIAGDVVSILTLMTGDIREIPGVEIAVKFFSLKMMLIRITFYLLFISFIVTLFMAGKQLQKKREPDSEGAVLRGRQAYIKIVEVGIFLDEAAVRIEANDIVAIKQKLKRIEEQLKIETDFGCGDSQVTECENEITEKLQSLLACIKGIAVDQYYNRNLQVIEQLIHSISSLLRVRRELSRK
ncbi:serine/threonine protein kinase [Paenibacillus aurantiacus]|uniref:non-specific serine/threonine protein kinase n=1 Tax=Paenibacillus aurantiacus TaxID=1936118 RepID=A0ABV5KLK0_9BACL